MAESSTGARAGGPTPASQISTRASGPTPASQISTRHAAVLIVLSDHPDPEILYTVRAQHLSHHAGETSFPGGGKEPGESPEETALREAWEEVRLDPDAVEIQGRLESRSTQRFKFNVDPIIGRVRDIDRVKRSLLADPKEVDQIHWVRASALANPINRGTWRFSGRSGPAFKVEDLLIWGLTAGMTSELLPLLGWDQPWDPSRHIPLS
ncbi:MAG: CoA pyrophosphatase [Arcanobacterium sp.]